MTFHGRHLNRARRYIYILLETLRKMVVPGGRSELVSVRHPVKQGYFQVAEEIERYSLIGTDSAWSPLP